MKLPFITRRKHERLMDEHYEQCRQTIAIRGRMWEKNRQMYEERMKRLEEQR